MHVNSFAIPGPALSEVSSFLKSSESNYYVQANVSVRGQTQTWPTCRSATLSSPGYFKNHLEVVDPSYICFRPCTLQLCISSRLASFISYDFFFGSILSSHSHGRMQGLRGIRLMDRKCQDIFSDQHCPLQWVSAGVPLIPALWLKSKLIVIITTFWYKIDTIVWQDELANSHCFIGSVLNSWKSCDTWAGHEGSHQGHSECGRGIQGSHQKSSGDARFARWETTTSWGTLCPYAIKS